MKATQPQTAAVQPSVGVRELVAWALVLAFVFASAGVVTGWFIHANAVSAPVVIQSSDSKS